MLLKVQVPESSSERPVRARVPVQRQTVEWQRDLSPAVPVVAGGGVEDVEMEGVEYYKVLY